MPRTNFMRNADCLAMDIDSCQLIDKVGHISFDFVEAFIVTRINAFCTNMKPVYLVDAFGNGDFPVTMASEAAKDGHFVLEIFSTHFPWASGLRHRQIRARRPPRQDRTSLRAAHSPD